MKIINFLFFLVLVPHFSMAMDHLQEFLNILSDFDLSKMQVVLNDLKINNIDIPTFLNQRNILWMYLDSFAVTLNQNDQLDPGLSKQVQEIYLFLEKLLAHGACVEKHKDTVIINSACTNTPLAQLVIELDKFNTLRFSPEYSRYVHILYKQLIQLFLKYGANPHHRLKHNGDIISLYEIFKKNPYLEGVFDEYDFVVAYANERNANTALCLAIYYDNHKVIHHILTTHTISNHAIRTIYLPFARSLDRTEMRKVSGHILLSHYAIKSKLTNYFFTNAESLAGLPHERVAEMVAQYVQPTNAQERSKIIKEYLAPQKKKWSWQTWKSFIVSSYKTLATKTSCFNSLPILKRLIPT